MSESTRTGTTVWIVETGEYEQSGVWGVYSSPEKAVEMIKADFGPPYVVEWEPLRTDRFGVMSLVGHFQAVVGKSTDHIATFDVRPFTLDGEQS